MSDTKKLRDGAMERKNKRLQKQVEANAERMATLKEQFNEYRIKTQEIVSGEISLRRKYAESAADSASKITELEQQIANQYKENAALRQDVATLRLRDTSMRSTQATDQKTIQRLEGELAAAYLAIKGIREQALQQTLQQSLFGRIFGRS
jgi:KaiC/GvpD/RAD55 family RecA-like ATPase